MKKVKRDISQNKRRFIYEKWRVEKYFPCFKCSLKFNHLECVGSIRPSEGFDVYKIRIKYVESTRPKVYIVEPIIKFNSKCHMFKDGSLCLYDHRDLPWSEKMLMHETIIPWIAEWIVFFEIWKLTGVWEGPEAVHGKKKRVTRKT